jgi:hypothetical protein
VRGALETQVERSVGKFYIPGLDLREKSCAEILIQESSMYANTHTHTHTHTHTLITRMKIKDFYLRKKRI